MDKFIQTDVAVIGAGIAGASLAAFLAPHVRVVILEREAHPGYHTTGRSAAMFIESYGPPHVRALTLASGGFLRDPPVGFADTAILTSRAGLIIADKDSLEALERQEDVFRSLGASYRRLNADACCAIAPPLRRDRVLGGLHEPASADIDVDGLLQAFLRRARRAGATLACNSEVLGLARDQGGWIVSTSQAEVRCGTVVNASGAWADPVARLAGIPPLGIEPRRRTAFTFAPPPGVDIRPWPMILDVNETWYIKPEAGMLLGTPANADPVPPHDVFPEDLDIAIAIDRIEAMTTLAIRRPARTWAGLRCFSPDGELVGGFDREAPGFFWCAGQGGYGIQSSPAMGEACAALVLGRPIPDHLQAFGVSEAALSPNRFRTRGS